jgi:hypothetical protein
MPQLLLVQANEPPLPVRPIAMPVRPPATVPVSARPSGDAAAARGIGLCVLVGVLCYAGLIKAFIGLIG